MPPQPYPFPLPIKAFLHDDDRREDMIGAISRAAGQFPEAERGAISEIIEKLKSGRDLSPTEVMLITRAMLKAKARTLPFVMPFPTSNGSGAKISNGAPDPYPYPYPIPRTPIFEDMSGPISHCEKAEECPIKESGRINNFCEDDVCSCEFARDNGCPLMFKFCEEETNLEKFERKMGALPNGTFKFTDYEVFKVGYWNGEFFSDEDVQEIADNFHKLRDVIKPSLIVGHDKKASEEVMKNSLLPSFGEVVDCRKKGPSLFVDLENVPGKIIEVLKKRAYRDRSVGLLVNYQPDKNGKRFRLVLDHVGLLGAKHPGVKGLRSIDDVLALYAEDEEQEKKHHILFSEITDVSKTEENEMSKELEKKLKAAEEKEKKLLADIEKQKKNLEKQKKDFEKTEAALKEAKESLEDQKKKAEEQKSDFEKRFESLEAIADENKSLKEKVDALDTSNKKFAQTFRKSRTEARFKENKEYFDKQVKAGKLIKAQEDSFLRFMDLVDGLDEVVKAKDVEVFAWGEQSIELHEEDRTITIGEKTQTAAQYFMDLIEGMPQRVDFSTRSKDSENPSDLEDSNRASDRLDAHAHKLMREAKKDGRTLTYEDAIVEASVSLNLTPDQVNQ